ncbi:glycosyltransferase [Georgenia sp. AZ-5]|uniref:glycosyltransferase n=1 Tax=Georgenia sp. AZ-5 TaxID=3367526 RepID=UPI00375405EE
MTQGKSPVLGVTRFSVFNPRSHAWQATLKHQSVEDYEQYLFDDERLAARFRTFFDWAMPTYQSMQEDHPYRHIVQYSDNLPERWKLRLLASAERFPVIALHNVSEDSSLLRFFARLLAEDPPKDGVFAWFRVDDDDVLPRNYLELVSRHINPATVGYAVSLGRGLTALHAGDHLVDVRECHHRMFSAGQLYVCRYDHASGKVRSLGQVDHTTVDRKMPVIVDSRSIGYLWLRHQSQDTVFDRTARQAYAEILADMSRHAKIADPTAYADLFPAMDEVLRRTAERDKEAPAVDSDVRLTDEGVAIPGEFVGGAVYRITYRLTCSTDARKTPALLSVAVTGTNLDMTDSGLTWSRHEGVDWFVYLTPTPGDSSRQLLIQLPPGAAGDRIRARTWHAGDASVSLNFLKMERLSA